MSDLAHLMQFFFTRAQFGFFYSPKKTALCAHVTLRAVLVVYPSSVRSSLPTPFVLRVFAQRFFRFTRCLVRIHVPRAEGVAAAACRATTSEFS